MMEAKSATVRLLSLALVAVTLCAWRSRLLVGGKIVQAVDIPAANKTPLTLVVEDEETVRQLTVEAIKSLGHRTLQAADAAEAMGLLEAHHPDIDLVLTVVRMPGHMNGTELAFAIRSRWPYISLVVSSGYFDARVSRLPMGCGFLAKPYRFAELSAMICSQLGPHRPA